jgi:hypothetical protein
VGTATQVAVAPLAIAPLVGLRALGLLEASVWVSGMIGGGVDTATVSGRLELAESAGGQATPVSVRLRMDDEWCVHDVWLEIPHREAAGV